MSKIRIAICGYGNLGKGVEKEIYNSKDMELNAVFTRRQGIKINSPVPVINTNDINEYIDKIDVVIMCGGSATDLPKQVPEVAKYFNTVDSFDTHAKIPEYFDKVNEIALNSKTTCVISGGWDPGIFSVMRTYADSFLPNGKTYTFWGKGVSQGHSDAIRRIPGVKNAIQYTIPIESAIESVRNGENPELTVSQKHLRECYVVLEENANIDEVKNRIITMPNYFEDYNTKVHFISEEELKEKHSKMYHGGFVIHSAKTGNFNKQISEFSLKLASNPEFTASILISLARAVYKLNKKNIYGARTMLDIPPNLLSQRTDENLRKELL